jgi:predicted nucleic acid-binding protein
MAELFLDAAYAIALSSPRDQCHVRAMELAGQIRAAGIPIVTTQAVVLEIGNALSKGRLRQSGIALIESLERDSNIEIVPLSEELLVRAFHLFRSRPDKEWGLTDCVSFVVMTERGLTEALTADDDFRQAGFRTLLTDPIGPLR